MNWLISIGCLLWSLVVVMVGYPSLKLPDGNVWLLGACGLVFVALLPWGVPVYLRIKRNKTKGQ